VDYDNTSGMSAQDTFLTIGSNLKSSSRTN